MFTGIIEEVGAVVRIQKGQHSAVLTVQAQLVTEDLKVGDSMAVNGVCLTVTSFSEGGFTADVMHETLNRSSFSKLKAGSHVNLERAMPANGRFGGHMVAGHVDGVGKIIGIKQDDTAVWYTVQAEKALMRYIVEKGSIAIDGISLTVAHTEADHFSVSVIPHTAKLTALKERKVGDLVNLENDIMGKYAEKLLRAAVLPEKEKGLAKEGILTKEFLSECGY